MADLDENTLELMERRLADQVVERVRPALFRLYAVAGSAVLTALGLFGWSLISDVKEHARTPGNSIRKDHHRPPHQHASTSTAPRSRSSCRSPTGSASARG